MKRNTLSNRLLQICFFLVISFCFVPVTLLAETAPLMIVDIEEQTTSSPEPLEVYDKSELLKYAKELQIQSQIIAKDYFYISLGLREEKAGNEIEQSGHDINKILSLLTANIKNQDSQNLLQYLNEIHEQSKEVLADKYTDENATLVIDYSETVYEASQSIIEHLTQNTEQKRSLQDDILQQQLLLQRISKFYIAYQAGFNDDAMFGKLKESIANFETGLETICSHKFENDEQQFTSVRLENYWYISKKFYEGMKQGELTLIVSVSTDHMVSYLDKILGYEKVSTKLVSAR